MSYRNKILRLLAKYEPSNSTLRVELEAKPWLELVLFPKTASGGTHAPDTSKGGWAPKGAKPPGAEGVVL